MSTEPGMYRHSKTGNYYVLLGTGTHTETQEQFVVYRRSGIMPSLPYQGVARRALDGTEIIPAYPMEIHHSTKTETDELMHKLWVRPLKMWDELVEIDGKQVERFVRVLPTKITDEIDF